MVVGPNAIPSSIVPNITPQKVPPILDEHGDVMEDSEWAHKGSRWCCKVDACFNFYAAKWLLHQYLERTHSFRMQAKKIRASRYSSWGPRLQDHDSMNVHILSNLHARQKQDEKKAFDRMKKKTKLKWDELQA